VKVKPAEAFRTVHFELDVPSHDELLLTPGRFERFPYVPADPCDATSAAPKSSRSRSKD